jgi:cell wall-associated NlpC family hydrolase
MALCLMALAEQRGLTVLRQAEGPTSLLRKVQLVTCGVVLALGVTLLSVPASAAPKPPNPSDQQLTAAQRAKNAMAENVGRLSALLVQSATKLQQLNAAAQLAEQKYALAISRLNDAKAASVKAQAAVVAAQNKLDLARANLKNYVRSSYMSGTIGSSTGGLLTATDANSLLQSGSYAQYVSERHVDVMAAMDRATVAKSNADAKARELVQLMQKLTDEANAAQQAAHAAYQQQQAQQAQLQAQQASYRQQLLAAQSQLATLQGQRKRFEDWQVQQARIAAERALRLRLAREAAERRAAAELARLQSSGGGGDNSALPPSGSMGGWTAGKGQAAVNRAMTQLGMPYAWAGGGYNGPTYGVNSPGTDGWNDSTVYGFDCSGLTMYAWAPQGLYLAHYAAAQFSQAGSYHPSPGNFMPGDLLFWGLPGQSDIHHVAMYIGNGDVIQAPYSGTTVQVTPWDQVSGDYFGATRPLT